MCMCCFKTCIDVFGGMSHITPWDSILLAAIEMDMHQVIRQCRYKASLALWAQGKIRYDSL